MRPMSEHTYKIIKLAGSSKESIEGAIENAVAKSDESLEQLRWFEVKETRGHIADGKVAHYQVIIEVGFTLK